MKTLFPIAILIAMSTMVACNLPAGDGASEVTGSGGTDFQTTQGLQPVEPSDPGALIWPQDLVYQGAFRLPDDPNGEGLGWEWGGGALTYYPEGDPEGADDGFPGSLFGSGHDWYTHVSEVGIPIPVIPGSQDLEVLPIAPTLQGFASITAGLVGPLEIPRVGLEYLPHLEGQGGGRLYFAFAQHMGETETLPSHGWAGLDLSNPQPAGLWRVGEYWNYVTGDYLFAIPPEWADLYTPGMYLATGRFRDGGQGGMGPSAFAIRVGDAGDPPAPGSTLAAIPLLQYASVYAETGPAAMINYSHADEWNGAAWLTSGGRAAVIFAGTKATGETWYGCMDGTVWPDDPPYPPECPERGWWSTQFEGQILFYDPAALAAVATGRDQPWEPQPYAIMPVDQILYNVTSPQQKSHVGGIAFDRSRGLIYLLELFADGDKPLVHVWAIQP